MQKHLMWVLVAVVMCSFLYAGEGEIDLAAKEVNLIVYFTYQETNDALEGNANPSWQQVFNDASKLLWNATNGQLRIGKVKVFLRALNKKEAGDLWIVRGDGGASAHRSGLGKPGYHIQLYQDTHRSLSSTYRGDFSIVHEMGHYVFGLRDQYEGYSVPIEKKDNYTEKDWSALKNNGTEKKQVFFSISKTDKNASIMDGGGGALDKNMRTEFDTAGNVVKGVADGKLFYINEHYAHAGKSCWEVLEEFEWKGNKVFTEIPTGDSPTDFPAGFQGIEFEVVPTLSRMVLCIDSSGSMDSANKIALARAGAKDFVRLLEEKHEIVLHDETIVIEGDKVAVVEFNGSAATRFSLQQVDKKGDVKGQAQKVIDAISASGSTAIGDGILQSLGEITGDGDPVTGEIIVLLSDGENTTGPDPRIAANSAKERGAQIFSIALGPDADIDTLGDIARITGGKLFVAANALALQPIYTKITSELKGSGLVNSIQSILEEQETAEHQIQVEEHSEETTFILSGLDEGWKFTIVSPKGKKYNGSKPEDGVLFNGDGTLLFYRVSNPVAGKWRLKVTAPVKRGSHQYHLITNNSAPAVEIVVDAPSQIIFPEKALIQCSVKAGDLVAGAKVDAQIIGPDGRIGKMVLYDDGQQEHGDEHADDGLYSGFYDSFPVDGVYTVEVQVENENGIQARPHHEDGGKPFDPQPIAPFIRSTSTAIEVQGVPPTNAEWLRLEAMSLKLNSKTGQAKMKIAMTVNNLQQSFAPLRDDLSIRIGNSSGALARVPAESFQGFAKKPGVFKVKDKALGISGTVDKNIGGSTRSEIALSFAAVFANGLDFSAKQQRITVTWGSFEQEVVIDVTSRKNSIAFSNKKNFQETPALFFDTIQASLDDRKDDSLRLVATIAGLRNYDPAKDSLRFQLDNFSLDLPPGAIVFKKNKGKAQVAIGNGSAKIQLDLNKKIFSLRAGGIDLTGLQPTTTASLEMGSFRQRNIITFIRQAKKGKQQFEY